MARLFGRMFFAESERQSWKTRVCDHNVRNRYNGRHPRRDKRRERVDYPAQRSLGLLDVTVERDAYGRQIDSAILTLETELTGCPMEMVFIRAPRITRVAAGVEVLARRENFPTLVRQGHPLAATFHPEMTADYRVKRLFLDMVRTHKSA